MKKLVMATVAVLMQGIDLPAHAAREIDCMVMWDRADVNRNGILEGQEATAFLDAIRKSTKKYGMKAADQLSAAADSIRSARCSFRGSCVMRDTRPALRGSGK